MARSEARIYTRIWADQDFATLSLCAQYTYFLVLSQLALNLCGVVPYQPRRWAKFSSETSSSVVELAVGELAERGYVVLDEDTEELLVRSFIHNDRVLEKPNVVVAMSRDFEGIVSPTLRQTILESIPEEFLDPFPEGFQERLGERFMEGIRERFPKRYGHRVRARPRPASASSSASSNTPHDGTLAAAAALRARHEEQSTQERARDVTEGRVSAEKVGELKRAVR